MTLRTQLVVMALMIAAVPAWAADSVDRSSPKSVFAAFRKAMNDRNWKAVFSLKTIEAQNGEIVRIAFGAAVSESDPKNPNELRAYRGIFAKHGIDWREVKKLASEAEATGDEDAFHKDDFLIPMRRIANQVTDKAALFSEVQSFFAKIGQPLSVTVLKLEKLDLNGDTADGEYSETRRLVATVTQEGREGQRVIHDAEARTSIRFRKIDGEWFID